MKTRVSVCLSEELMKRIDKDRGLVKRSNYIEHLVRLGLEVKKAEKVVA